jgi:hypothetical protein
MELVVDGAAPVELAYACNGNSAYPMVPSDRASGYLWTSMPQGVVIVGCHSNIAAGVGFAMYSPGATGTGTFTMGGAMGGWDVLTTDDSPDVWGYTGDTQSITITSFGEVGEPIVGTFSATVSNIKNFATRAVSGSFHVCRTADVMASP